MKRVTVAADATLQRKLDAKGDAVLAQLLAATPAQIDTYLTNNVTTMAQARTVLRSLLLAVRALAADQLR